MEFISTTVSIAEKLNTALQLWEFKDKLFSNFSYGTELEDLQRTVSSITAALHVAETKLELSDELQRQIEELKDTIFEADDLLDELVTLSHQQRVVDADGSLLDKVRHFFSSSNPICVSYWMSRGSKDIKKKLDDIANNNQFSLELDHEPIRNRRPETCSYVDEVEIIGRQHDLDHIVAMLLEPNVVQHNVSFLTIVGIGGLGKTALAQLLYNDARVTTAFPLRLWTCVADQDQKQLDVKDILVKILASATGKNPDQGSTMDQVQSRVQGQLGGKKFLLVLDDVWTESYYQWCDLARYLSRGARGSWIVVTTRSHETARIIGGSMHKLPGLSEENSWRLFEERHLHQTSCQTSLMITLVKIGIEIVNGCAGVPLAIRVAGSLLFGQGKSKWLSVQKLGLANIRESRNGIISILKLSFYNLETPLKSCFSYCALFPKDYVMEKEGLLSLWMAQGYIVPFDKGQTLLEAAEEYFSILLRRCFFQDIKKDAFGEIESCKMHDLMHDVAQSVSGNEIICSTNIVISDDLIKRARHLMIARSWKHRKYSLGKTYIRSHIFVDEDNDAKCEQYPVEALLLNCRCLRALDLSGLRIESLPDSIGELLHLRYLDLSYNGVLKVLPKSITKLYNLQTLNLFNCESLKELPKDLSKLVKLRVLDISECYELTDMPGGMDKLSCLERLSNFVVGKQWSDGLEDLKALNNLKGSLEVWIRWPENGIIVHKKDSTEGLYLRRKEHLNAIHFSYFRCIGKIDDVSQGTIISLIEDLQPHSNLKELEVSGYEGVRMPDWINLLPDLVHLYLQECTNLEYLPCLGNLSRLRYLEFSHLDEIEYIEGGGEGGEEKDSHLPGFGSAVETLSFFPSLKKLMLWKMPKLKGWMKEVKGRSKPPLQLPSLSKLQIFDCLELTCTIICPSLEDLELIKFNKEMRIIMNSRKSGESSTSFSSHSSTPEDSTSSSSCSDILVPKLKKVGIDNVAWLDSVSMESLQCLEVLYIKDNGELVDLPEWMQYLPALESLIISNCRGLRAMPNWMPKLTSLDQLEIWPCSESLERRCQKDPPGEDWPYIKHISDFYLN
uniref:NBS-LRR type resistance protein n=1 Tax=Beta vulgaris TaxID=161934 RepID=A0FD17_BETVU|nr:NBS-LRR type resistance protein [Beta vulgaris]